MQIICLTYIHINHTTHHDGYCTYEGFELEFRILWVNYWGVWRNHLGFDVSTFLLGLKIWKMLPQQNVAIHA